MVENFPPVPGRGRGGWGERRSVGVPRFAGKKLLIFSFSSRGGGGGEGLQSGGTGDRGLVSSLTQRDSSGQGKGGKGPKGGRVWRGEKRRMNVKKGKLSGKIIK